MTIYGTPARNDWICKQKQSLVEYIIKIEKGTRGDEKQMHWFQNIGNVPKTSTVFLFRIFPQYDNSTGSQKWQFHIIKPT